jgi:hypothetical protein
LHALPRRGRQERPAGDDAVMFLAPWLVCALFAWVMWWVWERQKRK